MRPMFMTPIALIVAANPAAAAMDVRSVTTAPGQEVRLGVFALFKKDCSDGLEPQIKMSVGPKNGLIVMRRATVATKRIENCPEIRGPAKVVLYRPNPGFTGTDSATFDVTNPETGQGQSHLFQITVLAGPAKLH